MRRRRTDEEGAVTVYVLMREVAHEFCDCWGVFTSKQKAEAHRDKIARKKYEDYEHWEIYVKMLDEGDEWPTYS